MELPNDLFTEVLVRLPLKDILISRCVCRAWNTLITTSYFTSYYANKSPFTSIILTQDNCNRTSFFLLEFGKNGDFIQTPIKPKLPEIAETDSRVSIIGSCDGSIFLLHRSCHGDRVTDKIYLCNPLFQSCVKIVEDRAVTSRYYEFLEYNVGYIPSTNKYKLLSLFYDGEKVKQAKILTVGVDEVWRIVKDPFTIWGFSTKGIFFNGAYHWVAKNENLVEICTFDLLEEKCSGSIPMPLGLVPFKWKMVNLAILNDRLSLIDHSVCSESEIGLWVMEEYGVAESWSRNVVFTRSILSLCRRGGRGVWLVDTFPIAVLRNGDILFHQKVVGGFFFFSIRRNGTLIPASDVDCRLAGKLRLNTFAPRFY